MRLLTATYNAGGIGGFTYGLVDMDKETAKLILKRKEIFDSVYHASDSIVADTDGKRLQSMEYSDYSARFLSGVPEDVDTSELDEGGAYLQSGLTDEAIAEYVERAESNRMVITSDGVYWKAYPKHADNSMTVETSWIDYGVIEGVPEEGVAA